MKRATFKSSKRSVYNAALKVATNLQLDINKKSLVDGYLHLMQQGGLLSYGNKIEVKIKSINEMKQTVTVSSNSMKLQLIDWGTNDTLETEVIDGLIKILK